MIALTLGMFNEEATENFKDYQIREETIDISGADSEFQSIFKISPGE
jgi:hypothetical protein